MTLNSKATALPSLRPAKTGVLAGLVALAQVWRLRSQSRRALSLLDDRMLRDIGLDPVAAAGETKRRFWED